LLATNLPREDNIMPSARKRKLRRSLGKLLGATALTDDQKQVSGFVKNLLDLRMRRYDGAQRPFGQGSVVANTAFDNRAVKLDNFAARPSSLGSAVQLDADVGIFMENGVDFRDVVGTVADDTVIMNIGFKIPAELSSTGVEKFLGLSIVQKDGAPNAPGETVITDGTTSYTVPAENMVAFGAKGLTDNDPATGIGLLFHAFDNPAAHARCVTAVGSIVAAGLDLDVKATKVKNPQGTDDAGLLLEATKAGPGQIQMVVDLKGAGDSDGTKLVKAGQGTYDFTAGHGGLPLANSRRYFWTKDDSNTSVAAATVLDADEGILYSPNGPHAQYVGEYDDAAGSHATPKYLRIKPRSWADGKKITFYAKGNLHGTDNDADADDDYVKVFVTADGTSTPIGGQELADLRLCGHTDDTSVLVERIFDATNDEGVIVQWAVCASGTAGRSDTMHQGWTLAWKVEDTDNDPAV